MFLLADSHHYHRPHRRFPRMAHHQPLHRPDTDMEAPQHEVIKISQKGYK